MTNITDEAEEEIGNNITLRVEIDKTRRLDFCLLSFVCYLLLRPYLFVFNLLFIV